MSDYRGRLIDTAARAMAELRVVSGPNTVSRIDIRRAEAVIDALGITPSDEFDEHVHEDGRRIYAPTFFVACLEAPAVQTHDSDPESQHGI